MPLVQLWRGLGECWEPRAGLELSRQHPPGPEADFHPVGATAGSESLQDSQVSAGPLCPSSECGRTPTPRRLPALDGSPPQGLGTLLSGQAAVCNWTGLGPGRGGGRLAARRGPRRCRQGEDRLSPSQGPQLRPGVLRPQSTPPPCDSPRGTKDAGGCEKEEKWEHLRFGQAFILLLVSKEALRSPKPAVWQHKGENHGPLGLVWVLFTCTGLSTPITDAWQTMVLKSMLDKRNPETAGLRPSLALGISGHICEAQTLPLMVETSGLPAQLRTQGTAPQWARKPIPGSRHQGLDPLPLSSLRPQEPQVQWT